MLRATCPREWGLGAVLALALANLAALAMAEPDASRYVFGLRLVAIATACGLVVLWAARYRQAAEPPVATFKGEIVRSIRRVRKLVARCKRCRSRDDAMLLLATPAAMAVADEALAVKLRLRSALNTYETAHLLTPLKTWPDTALAHLADVFERLLPDVDPESPA